MTTTTPSTPTTPTTPADAYAGAVSRLAAYVVDLGALSTLLAVGSAVAAFLIAVITGHEPDLSRDRDLAGVGLGIWGFVYFAGSWALAGRTLGMALLGVRVARPDGTAISALQAVIRTLAFALSVALFGLGFLGILFHAQRRALHDLIAGTTVVYTFGRPVGLPAPPDAGATPAGQAPSS
jgi:uncharacterized RDD family membrane protein YckC